MFAGISSSIDECEDAIFIMAPSEADVPVKNSRRLLKRPRCRSWNPASTSVRGGLRCGDRAEALAALSHLGTLVRTFIMSVDGIIILENSGRVNLVWKRTSSSSEI